MQALMYPDYRALPKAATTSRSIVFTLHRGCSQGGFSPYTHYHPEHVYGLAILHEIHPGVWRLRRGVMISRLYGICGGYELKRPLKTDMFVAWLWYDLAI